MAVSMYVPEDMMETRQMTLTDFLLARIAEDEERASRTSYYWNEGPDLLDHIETHHVDLTARVLAECEAKRRIVALHRPARFIDVSIGVNSTVCLICHFANEHYPDAEGIPRLMQELHPCGTLRYLALPYADHPDYRREWRP